MVVKKEECENWKIFRDILGLVKINFELGYKNLMSRFIKLAEKQMQK
jgi:hypothetical protein